MYVENFWGCATARDSVGEAGALDRRVNALLQTGPEMPQVAVRGLGDHHVECCPRGRQRKRLAAVGAWLAIVGLAACGGASSSDNVVARVGRFSITKAALERRMMMLAPGPLPQPDQRQYQTLKQRALGLMISADGLVEEAAERGVGTSTSEIQRAFERKKAELAPSGDAEFNEFLKESGRSAADIRLETQTELAAAKLERLLAREEPKTTQQQITQYYSANRQRYVVPERRMIEIVELRSEAAARRARREIESGRSISSMAPLRESFGRFERASEPGWRTIEAAIFTARPHALAGPLKLRPRSLFAVFEVTSVTPAVQKTLAQVHGQIAEQLAARQRQVTLSDFTREWSRRWTARTNCRLGFVVQQCSQYKGVRSTPGDPLNLG